MTLSERLPTMTDQDLANLDANAMRLESEAGERGVAARDLRPLIAAELSARLAAKPPKPKRAPARKTAEQPPA